MNHAPHVIEALFRQSPELLGVIEPDALDHAVDILLKARQHEAGIAPGCGPRHLVGLQYRHRPAAPRHLARHGQARQPGADHADVDIEIEIQARSLRACNPGRLIPARRRALVFAHRYNLSHRCGAAMAAPRMLDCRRFEIDASASPCPPSDTPCAAFYCYATPRLNGPSPERRTFPAS